MRSGLKKYYKAAINQFLVNHYHSCYELRVSKTRTMAFLPFCTFLTTLSHEKHCLGCAKMETFLSTVELKRKGFSRSVDITLLQTDSRITTVKKYLSKYIQTDTRLYH